jgi:hypothetical protein
MAPFYEVPRVGWQEIAPRRPPGRAGNRQIWPEVAHGLPCGALEMSCASR